MRCPYCASNESKVTNKRDVGSEARRRRECLKCGKRFTTLERVELDLSIIKKDGKREKFSREKVVRGLVRSLEKRPLTDEQIEKLVEDIVTNVYRVAKDKDIKSSRVGDIVMSNLKKVDKIAYVRFAAVYRDFANIEEFREELEKLK
jgi:transcriptional repressor NrdR